MIDSNYIYIEPHPDDMILSSGVLFQKKKPKMVITVFSSIKNSDDGTERLCRKFNIPYKFLKFPDIDLNNSVIDFSPNELLISLQRLINDDDMIITTMGYGHPAHTFIRDLMLKHFKSNELLFARDFPHSYKDRGRFWNHTHLFKLHLAINNGFTEKIKLFKEFYKSQAGLLWFDKKYFDMKPFEEYYVLKNKEFWG